MNERGPGAFTLGMTSKAINGAAAVALTGGALLALAACSRGGAVNAPADQSSAPALSGAPPASSQPPPHPLQVNPPTPGAPPPNAGDVQAQKGLGPGGPVNSPRRLHESTDGERG